jgi:hypothetical protein
MNTITTLPRLIGLTGTAGSGKDTVRRMLEEHHGFAGFAFADPIRAMLGPLLAHAGAGHEWMYDRDRKEQTIPALGTSYRHLAQTLGTEWGRSIEPEFWLRIASARLDAMQDHGHRHFVISDVRFLNEAAWIKLLGGEVWRIDRPSAEPVRAHASELISHINPDRVIDNSGTVEDLWRFVNDVLWDRRVAA